MEILPKPSHNRHNGTTINSKLLSLILFSVVLTACDNAPKAEKTVHLAPDGVFSAALSEHYALLGTVQGNAELWQLSPKTLLHTWQHTDAGNGIIEVAIAGNEEFAITAERDSIAWWRITDGQLLGVWSLPEISAVSLSADGQFALIGLKDKAIYFALAYGQTIYAFPHQQPVTTTAIALDNSFAITGSEDESAKLWRLDNGELAQTWQQQNKLATVALSADGKYALTNAALSQTQIWRTATGRLATDIGPKLMTVSAAAFSPDGKYLVTGRTSQRIDLWNTASGRMITFWRPVKDTRWRPSAATILALAFTPDGKKIYSIAANGYLKRVATS